MKKQSNSSQNSKPRSSKLEKTVGQGMAQAVREEQNAIIIDYKVDQSAAPSIPEVHSSHDWANIQEGLRFQVEAERKRAMALTYKYLTPPK